MQAGHEHTLTGLIPALAGSSLIFGSGLLDSGLTVDPALLVADSEFISMIRQVVNGMRVTDETLMIDEIISRGPEAEYLTAKSTLSGLKALSAPRLLDRRARSDWEKDGSQDMYRRAHDEARRILAEEKVEPLPEEILARLDSIVADADAKYAGTA